MLNIPLNRVIAFFGPYIAIISGAVSTWVVVHLHFLALFHIGGDQIAYAITQVLVFAVTTLVVWLGHQKWLQGHHVQIQADAVRGATQQLQTVLTTLISNENRGSGTLTQRKTPGA